MAPEQCNGLDDDCDGIADEGTLGLLSEFSAVSDMVPTASVAASTDGELFAVAWVLEDFRTGEGNAFSPYLAWVDQDGRVLRGPEALDADIGPAGTHAIEAINAGDEVAVLWTKTFDSGEVHLGVAFATHAVVRASVVLPTNVFTSDVQPRAAWSGDELYVVLGRRFWRFDSNAQPLTALGGSIGDYSGSGTPGAIAWSNGALVLGTLAGHVVWVDSSGLTIRDIDLATSLLSETPTVVADTTGDIFAAYGDGRSQGIVRLDSVGSELWRTETHAADFVPRWLVRFAGGWLVVPAGDFLGGWLIDGDGATVDGPRWWGASESPRFVEQAFTADVEGRLGIVAMSDGVLNVAPIGCGTEPQGGS